MLIERLTSALATLARLDSERALVAQLQRAVVRLSLLERGAQREEAEGACVRDYADAIRAEPWPLPEEAIFALGRAAGPLRWPEAMAALLRGGAGAAGLSPGNAGGCWVPSWLAREAARRTASPPPPVPERWAMAERFPIPMRQSFIAPALARGPLAEAASPFLAGPALEVPTPLPPEPWLAPRQGLPAREELLRLARTDPRAALRALAGLHHGPCWGWTREIARILLGAALGAGASAARAQGIDAVRQGGRIALRPGWMLACAQALGWTLRGAPAAATMPCEEAWLARGGGVVALDGQCAVRWHLLAQAPSAWLQSLPVPWLAADPGGAAAAARDDHATGARASPA